MEGKTREKSEEAKCAEVEHRESLEALLFRVSDNARDGTPDGLGVVFATLSDHAPKGLASQSASVLAGLEDGK